MFSHTEVLDIYEAYIKCNKNSKRAAELYQNLYPERRQPNVTYYLKAARKVRRTFHNENQRRVRHEEVVNDINVLALIHINPEISQRQIASECGLSKSGVGKIIKKHKLHPYKIHYVHGLRPGDYEKRREFCQWILDSSGNNINFLKTILWTDETRISNVGGGNPHNSYYYATQNPHRIRENHHQGHFSINIWCGLIDNYMLGPFNFFNNLNGENYLHFLQNALEDMIDEMPLNIRANFKIFMHDGAPAHRYIEVTNYLNTQFHRWIGASGQRNHQRIKWPPRSPDLNPLDYFLWGHVKNMLHTHQTATVEELQLCVNQAFQRVRPEMISAAITDLRKRAELCLQHNGGHFEHLL